MVDITEVAPGIACIDDRICGVPRLHGVYLLDAPRKAIIDSGPASSVPIVLEGIRQQGIDPAEVEYVVVTHVHLDHAGGAGTLLREMPQAKVVVHHRGARHLGRMDRLVTSAIAAQGEATIRRYGTSLPVATDRILEVGEGSRLELGDGQVLEFMDTPGHAQHELCIKETRNGGIFVGDSLGLLLGDHSSLFTCHPPPSYHPVECITTARRLAREVPTALYFAHFGATRKVSMILEQAVNRIQESEELVEASLAEFNEEDVKLQLSALFRAQVAGIGDAELIQYSIDMLIPSCIDGVLHRHRRKYGIG
jgi:glyoxylase-like metal-dependent hydrolase (beta-lactamase superfamily II)